MGPESQNGRRNGNGAFHEQEALRAALSERQQLAKAHEKTRLMCSSLTHELRQLLDSHCPAVHPGPIVGEFYTKLYERLYPENLNHVDGQGNSGDHDAYY